MSDRSQGETPLVQFSERLTNSAAFGTLFREGMDLVEETAAYLDGAGRTEAKALERSVSLTYATESMRLTTRLMQIASWLLLRRAVNEGELTPIQAQSERHRVRLSRQDISCDDVTFCELPPEFVDLCERSIRLQARVLHLDRSNAAPREAGEVPTAPPLAQQIAMLQAAFSGR